MRRRLLLACCAVMVLVFAGAFVPPVEAHYVKGCHGFKCKRHVIRPYRASFLGPVGACESGTHSYSLRAGLRAYNPAGPYYNRYQFNMGAWRGAGGRGDPRDAPWYEQAYRAVVWLHINGRQSWPNC